MKLYNGDCIDIMKTLPDNSIDMVLCDPPYGTTQCKWDLIIPFEEMWLELRRIVKRNGAIVLTSANPFSSLLVTSNLKDFRYSLVWDKVNKYTGSLNSNKMPLRRHEDIMVFYRALPTFNKQYREGEPYTSTNNNGHGAHTRYGKGKEFRTTVNKGKHNPCSVIEIRADCKKELGLHPTQKPIALMEYLIRTYSNEEEVILDFTMGSGTVGVACLNTNREFIGIELDVDYFNIAKERIEEQEWS